MAMTRLQRHHQAACDRYRAGRDKPPTRKQAIAWLAPIRNAFAEIATGEVDSHRGYAITRIHWADEDFARIDHCINGFTAMMRRVFHDLDTSALDKVSRKLANGILLTTHEVEACFATLKEAENLLITVSRKTLIDAAVTEQVNIEFERMGIKDAV